MLIDRKWLPDYPAKPEREPWPTHVQAALQKRFQRFLTPTPQLWVYLTEYSANPFAEIAAMRHSFVRGSVGLQEPGAAGRQARYWMSDMNAPIRESEIELVKGIAARVPLPPINFCDGATNFSLSRWNALQLVASLTPREVLTHPVFYWVKAGLVNSAYFPLLLARVYAEQLATPVEHLHFDMRRWQRRVVLAFIDQNDASCLPEMKTDLDAWRKLAAALHPQKERFYFPQAAKLLAALKEAV